MAMQCFFLKDNVYLSYNSQSLQFIEISTYSVQGAARNFVREGPVADVVRLQTLAILHKDYFNVTGKFLICYNRI